MEVGDEGEYEPDEVVEEEEEVRVRTALVAPESAPTPLTVAYHWMVARQDAFDADGTGEARVEVLGTDEYDKEAESAERTTTKYMTKYERARILGTRALQIRCNRTSRAWCMSFADSRGSFSQHGGPSVG